MEGKSIKKNYIYNLIYQMVALITPLVTTPYISRVLGADGIGTYSFASSVVSNFVLFAVMGIPIHGQREISYAQADKNKRSEVFWNVQLLEFFSAGILLTTYIGFSFLQKNTGLYLILSMEIISAMLDISWLFSGMEEFGKIAFRNIAIKIINIVFIFYAVQSNGDFFIYVFGMVGFKVVSSVSLWFYLPQYINSINKSKLQPFKQLKTVVSLFIPTIAIQIYTVLDKTMIGVITQDAFENGYYEQAIKIPKMVLTVVTSLCAVVIPRIGFYFRQGDFAEIRRLMYRGYRFVWMMGIPLCMGIVALSDVFVPWFFGPGYGRVSELLSILAFLILAIGINNLTGMQYLIPTKKQNVFTGTVVIGAITNFLMNCLLIPTYGALGAAVSSVAAESVIAIVQIVIVKKELSSLKILKEGTYYFFAGMLMYICLITIKGFFSVSMTGTAMLAIIGAIVYICVLMVLRDDFLISNAKPIMQKIARMLRNLK